MAEEGGEVPEGSIQDAEPVKKPPKKKLGLPCNTRIDELARPKRWRILGTWRDFSCILEPLRVERLKEKVQELFSMSPEETELYFNALRQKKPRRIDIKALRRRLKKERAKARREAYCILQVIMKKAMKYAFKHAPPLLVTPVLRIVSDHILEILSELHKIPLPKRTDTDMLSHFLISVSDWTAIFMANIYYQIEVDERRELETMKKLQAVKSISTVTPKEGEHLPTEVSDFPSTFGEGMEGEDYFEA